MHSLEKKLLILETKHARLQMKVEHNLQLDEQKVSKDYQGLENRIMALKALLDERVYK